MINRLIKTGKLGNESIDAILDSQFKPKGIFRKLISFMGITEKSYADEIYARYGFKEHLKAKLVVRDDLGEDELKELKRNISERDNQLRSEYGNKSHGSQGNSLKLGKQAAAPGQEKRLGSQTAGQGNSGGHSNGKGNGGGAGNWNKGGSSNGGSHSNGNGSGGSRGNSG